MPPDRPRARVRGPHECAFCPHCNPQRAPETPAPGVWEMEAARQGLLAEAQAAALAQAREEGRREGRKEVLDVITCAWVNCLILRDTLYSGVNPRQSANHYRMELCRELLGKAGITVTDDALIAEEAPDA